MRRCCSGGAPADDAVDGGDRPRRPCGVPSRLVGTTKGSWESTDDAEEEEPEAERWCGGGCSGGETWRCWMVTGLLDEAEVAPVGWWWYGPTNLTSFIWYNRIFFGVSPALNQMMIHSRGRWTTTPKNENATAQGDASCIRNSSAATSARSKLVQRGAADSSCRGAKMTKKEKVEKQSVGNQPAQKHPPNYAYTASRLRICLAG
jgi:hypothetical protein